jgi:phosphopantetheinyl transferase
MLKEDIEMSPYLTRLREYMIRKYDYKNCSEETIIGRLLLKYLFPLSTWNEMLDDIDYMPTGKPFFRSQAIQFNISHTDDIVVLAFAEDVNLGVDIVRVDRKNEYAHLFLHEEELNNSDNEKTLYYLNTTWAKKESMGKLVGEGWGIRFSKINSLQPLSYQDKQIYFSEIKLEKGYYCIICTDEEVELAEISKLWPEELINKINILIN